MVRRIEVKSKLRTYRIDSHKDVHDRVKRAVDKGELARPYGCQYCGAEGVPIQAHHHHYDGEGAWKDIQWLCVRCHAKFHVAKRRTDELRGNLEGHLASFKSLAKPGSKPRRSRFFMSYMGVNGGKATAKSSAKRKVPVSLPKVSFIVKAEEAA